MLGRRLALVGLVIQRLALREECVPRTTRIVARLSLATTLAMAVALLAGWSPLWFVAAFGLATLVALPMVVLTYVPPAMGVTIVGIALSCASLTTALSVTTGFRQEVLGAVGRINGHVLLTKYGLDFAEYPAVIARLRDDPRVRAASPFAYAMAAVVGPVSDSRHPASLEHAGRATEPPSIVVGKGIDPEAAARLEGFRELLERGDVSVLRPGDAAHTPGIVLGSGLAARLGVEIGEIVRVVVPAELDSQETDAHRPPRWANFQLLDILHSGSSELDRNFALMHLSAAQAVFFQEGRVTGIEFQLFDPEDADDVAESMRATLGFPYRLSTWKESNAAMLATLEQIRITLMVVLGLMVVVASASLVATLLLVIRRKRHDIAVLQTLGADRSLIFWTFEALGIVVGGAGSLLGASLGLFYCGVLMRHKFPLGADVYPVDHLPVVMSVGDTLGPMLAAVAICAAASGPVAALASRVIVLDALREG